MGDDGVAAMKVAIRADAGLHMGSGHVMRCLTLAQAMAAEGAQVLFLCRAHDGHLAEKIESLGFVCRLLAKGSDRAEPDDPPHAHWLGATWEEDAAMTEAALAGGVDLLVVDHYGLERRWERALRSRASRIIAIDDLADRTHDADLLLDQNYGRQAGDYRGLVSPDCRILAGSRYALLRPEFSRHRPMALARRKAWAGPQHLLISMGGVDAPNHTGKIIEALKSRSRIFREITIVLGATAPHRDAVELAVRDLDARVSVIYDAGNMARLMTDADIAIGAAGATSWERCCLGLPTVSVIMAENQVAAAHRLTRAGALLGAFTIDELEPDLLHQAINPAPDLYAKVSAAAEAICDGQGIRRVVAEVGS